jgi:hypothetical protein
MNKYQTKTSRAVLLFFVEAALFLILKIWQLNDFWPG